MNVEPKRGEVWTVAAGGGRVTSKPRPALVMTSDVFADFDFITVLLITTNQTAGFTRIPIPANKQTGLTEPSMIQAEKIVTVHRRNLRQRCGYVTPKVLANVRAFMTAYLGFSG